MFSVFVTDNGHWVMQNFTDPVRKFSSKTKANKYLKFLESGGAFAGEIPKFMFNGVDRPKLM